MKIITSNTMEMKYVSSALFKFPKFSNRKQFNAYKNNYGDVSGGSIPERMLKVMFSDIIGDLSIFDKPELEYRTLRYCLSKGNSDLWTDLKAAVNGSKETCIFLFYCTKHN